SAPPFWAARPGGTICETFGVNLTITGRVETSLTHSVTMHVYSGTWPIAEPMPRSLIPCGQPKLSSKPSQPVSCDLLTISCHASRFDSTISDTITVLFGYFFLHS